MFSASLFPLLAFSLGKDYSVKIISVSLFLFACEMLRSSFTAQARRKHFVATPYDTIHVNLAPALSKERLFTSISKDAGVSNDWRNLNEAEVQRLLRVLPAYADSCKERHIQLRRMASYYDLRRAAGHRARVRLHGRLGKEMDEEGLQKWGRAHLFPAEP